MGMIEFEDHSEENQRALLAYLKAQKPDRAVSVRPRRPVPLSLIARVAKSFRLAWAAVSPRFGR